MEDRIVQFPNRIKLVPVDGQPNTYDIEEVPGEVTSEGTPLSKATLLSDITGERYGLDPTGTLDQAFSNNVRALTATVDISNWSSAPGSDGYYTNTIGVPEMKSDFNPFADVIISSAEVAEDEKDAFSNILEIETLDGSIVCKAISKPFISINIRLIGV